MLKPDIPVAGTTGTRSSQLPPSAPCAPGGVGRRTSLGSQFSPALVAVTSWPHRACFCGPSTFLRPRRVPVASPPRSLVHSPLISPPLCTARLGKGTQRGTGQTAAPRGEQQLWCQFQQSGTPHNPVVSALGSRPPGPAGRGEGSALRAAEEEGPLAFCCVFLSAAQSSFAGRHGRSEAERTSLAGLGRPGTFCKLDLHAETVIPS